MPHSTTARQGNTEPARQLSYSVLVYRDILVKLAEKHCNGGSPLGLTRTS